MAADINNPSTWQRSVLYTSDSGPIYYWVLGDKDGYFEQWEMDANQTSILIAVAWDDREKFKRYAMGFAKADSFGFVRYLPLAFPVKSPQVPSQYLVSLKKKLIHAGTDAQGRPAATDGYSSFARPDPYLGLVSNGGYGAGNWWTLPPTTGMPPRIVYTAVFASPEFDVAYYNDAGILATPPSEMLRYVVREREIRGRERKVPSFGFETDDAEAVPIPEVGFVPHYDFEMTYTWMRVPLERVPDSAIANCLLRTNNAAFDDLRKPGRYPTDTILFKGLAGKEKPYRGNNGEWLVNLPYLFSFQPNGQNTVPRNGGYWSKIRARGTSANPVPLYRQNDLAKLFLTQPDVAIQYNLPPGTYKRGFLGAIPVAVQFSAVCTGTVGALTYAWAFGDGGTSTAANPYYLYTTAGNFTVSLTVTDSGVPKPAVTVGPYVIM